MQFPLPTLLVTHRVTEDNIDLALEGSLIEAVEVFDTNALLGRRYAGAIIVWSNNPSDDSGYTTRLHEWVQTKVVPRLRGDRPLLWL